MITSRPADGRVFRVPRKRTSKPDLAIGNDSRHHEGLHVCGTEPRGSPYAEVDAGGVPALWCIPQGSDNRACAVTQPITAGPVVLSMHLDRKGMLGISQGHGSPCPGGGLPAFTGTPISRQPMMWTRRTSGCLPQGYRPRNLVSSGHSIGGNFAVSLAVGPVTRNPTSGCHPVDLPWYDMR